MRVSILYCSILLLIACGSGTASTSNDAGARDSGAEPSSGSGGTDANADAGHGANGANGASGASGANSVLGKGGADAPKSGGPAPEGPAFVEREIGTAGDFLMLDDLSLRILYLGEKTTIRIERVEGTLPGVSATPLTAIYRFLPHGVVLGGLGATLRFKVPAGSTSPGLYRADNDEGMFARYPSKVVDGYVEAQLKTFSDFYIGDLPTYATSFTYQGHPYGASLQLLSDVRAPAGVLEPAVGPVGTHGAVYYGSSECVMFSPLGEGMRDLLGGSSSSGPPTFRYLGAPIAANVMQTNYVRGSELVPFIWGVRLNDAVNTIYESAPGVLEVAMLDPMTMTTVGAGIVKWDTAKAGAPALGQVAQNPWANTYSRTAPTSHGYCYFRETGINAMPQCFDGGGFHKCYLYGLLHGEYSETANGMSGQYEGGFPTGQWSMYDGRTVGTFENGLPVGKWKFLSGTGKNSEEKSFGGERTDAFGNRVALLQGEYKKYDSTGSYVATTGLYEAGYKTGNWDEKDSQGRGVSRRTYDSAVLIEKSKTCKTVGSAQVCEPVLESWLKHETSWSYSCSPGDIWTFDIDYDQAGKVVARVCKFNNESMGCPTGCAQ